MNKPWIAIDLDSTIANCDHRLKFILNMETGAKLHKKERNYDKFFSNCILDLPLVKNIEFLEQRYPLEFFEWVFITGRPEKMRDESVEWILTHTPILTSDFYLYMRQEGDNRVDNITKSELMRGAIQDLGDNPVACFDDRPGVRDAWNEIVAGTIIVDLNEEVAKYG